MGAGDSLRRRAVASTPADEGWTRLEVPYASASNLADEMLSYGADVIVDEPAEIRADVVRRLRRLAGEQAAS
jgi:proteasome accessory factor B